MMCGCGAVGVAALADVIFEVRHDAEVFRVALVEVYVARSFEPSPTFRVRDEKPADNFWMDSGAAPGRRA